MSYYLSDKLFSAPVPIYDSHMKKKAFTFTDENFCDFPSWLLFHKGGQDLPADAVVAVGYTLNIYTGPSLSVLLTNVQFVILLTLTLADLL